MSDPSATTATGTDGVAQLHDFSSVTHLSEAQQAELRVLEAGEAAAASTASASAAAGSYRIVQPQPSALLLNGHRIPLVGLGTWYAAGEASKEDAAITKRAEDTPSPLVDAVVAEVAAKLGKSPAQVLVRWAVQRGTSVLPKSVKQERIRSNLDVFDWAIPADLFERLSALPHQQRMVDGSFWISADGPYRTFQDLWDE
ncbi:Aldose reductase [Tetrabaena socialis]|uniref:Aldose reductase n=1 Tax=Tetrabaena socialis TaxID=47790 RepID=A0A2J8ACQ4_9CHLO|nr:Aldose reductase [Tetrabaena socialis]|eukprot:PNH10301.1 Aldose reductase [Tetrabaena socialis]